MALSDPIYTRHSDYLFKMVMVGNSGVGKSALLKRVSDGDFTGEYTATIGVDFAVKTFEVDGKKARLQIWDTAGQERFHTMTTAYYRGVHAIMLVYDVCDKDSFFNVKRWHQEAKEHSGDEAQMILIANKCDKAGEDREVSYDAAQTLADALDIPLFEASAKDGTNVEQAFDCILRQSIKHKVRTHHAPRYFDNSRTDLGRVSYGGSRRCCSII